MGRPPDEPWIEFLDDPAPADGGEPAALPPQRGWPGRPLGGLALAAVLVLAGARLVQGQNSPPVAQGADQRPTPAASPVPTPSAASVPTPSAASVQTVGVAPGPLGDEPAVSGSVASRIAILRAKQAAVMAFARTQAVVASAVEQFVGLDVVGLSSEVDGSGTDRRPALRHREIDADSGSIHMSVVIDRSGSQEGGPNARVPSGGPGLAVMIVEVENAGFHVRLTVTGPRGRLPNRAELAALGSDPRLLAVG